MKGVKKASVKNYLRAGEWFLRFYNIYVKKASVFFYTEEVCFIRNFYLAYIHTVNSTLAAHIADKLLATVVVVVKLFETNQSPASLTPEYNHQQ